MPTVERVKPLLLIALLLAAPALAGGEKKLGTVDGVDLGRAELGLDSGKVLKLNRDVEVTRNDAPVSLDDLEPGDEVRARYDLRGELAGVDAKSKTELTRGDDGWEGTK